MKLRPLLIALLAVFAAGLSPVLSEPLAIREIQYNNTFRGFSHDCYPSPLCWSAVEVQGVVTARPILSTDFWLQDSAGLWNGVVVENTSLARPAVGDTVFVSGVVLEIAGLTLISASVPPVIRSCGGALPAPIDIACADLGTSCSARGESYEGVLVALHDVVVCRDLNANGEWYVRSVSGGSDSCQIDTKCFYHNPNVGDTIGTIVGVVGFDGSAYEILPRSSSDIRRPYPEVVRVSRNSFLPRLLQPGSRPWSAMIGA
jgi:hypothetical protein